MSSEVSYLSRFFVKFVEVIAAGVATAISAYLLAHFGGLLPPSPTSVSAPAPTAVQVGPTASEVAESRRFRYTRGWKIAGRHYFVVSTVSGIGSCRMTPSSGSQSSSSHAARCSARAVSA